MPQYLNIYKTARDSPMLLVSLGQLSMWGCWRSTASSLQSVPTSSPGTVSSATAVSGTPFCRVKMRSLSITSGSCLRWNKQQLDSERSREQRSLAWSSFHLTRSRAHDHTAVQPVMSCVRRWRCGQGYTPHPSCRARCAGCVRQASGSPGTKYVGKPSGLF